MAHRTSLITAACLLIVACGIDVVGVAPLDGGAPFLDGGNGSSGTADGAPSSDGGGLSPDASICSETCPATRLDATPFQLALFGDTQSPCPAGFQSSDVVEDPSARPGSCVCGACQASGATCNATTFQIQGADNAQCSPGGGAVLNINNGACTGRPNGHFIYDYTSVSPINPSSAGTCVVPGQVVPEQIEKPTRHLCSKSPDTCPGAICGAPPGLKACLVAEGDNVACPVDAPIKHVVGADITASCGNCACTPTATCNPTMTVYEANEDSNCAAAPKATIRNGCTQVNQLEFLSYRLTLTTTQGCTVGAAPNAATVQLSGARTVCCPP